MKKQSTRRPYKKHLVLVGKNYIPVKDWYRDNQQHFQHIQGVPTSNQIGVVLIRLGYGRNDTETEILYR
jgi:hypothetical protein